MNAQDKPNRREFIASLVGTSVLLTTPGLSETPISWPTDQQAMTVGQVMDLILKTIPGAPFPKTVDTLKSGNRDQKVTGIVTTMFTTTEVIQKAIAAGANFIIAHEPTFYNHLDETDWLQKDEVFRHKHDLLTKHGIAVWRFHDYWHSHRPDGIWTGVLAALGWEKYAGSSERGLLTMPATPLHQLIDHAKAKLDIKLVRVVGDPAQTCQRVLLMPGSSGGRSQIQAIEQTRPDAILCGEVSEWETPEYVRDARQQGQKLSLVVLGHVMSEAAGMQWLVSWLQPKVPGLKVSYVPSQNPFTYV